MNAAARIIASAPALLLATVNADGSPHASYVPFAPIRDGLGIAVSGLAAHTANLATRPHVCALIVCDEVAPDGPYARARISIDLLARPIAADADTAATIWGALETRHGAVATILRSLPDFRTFVLEPLGGRLVLGFASASELDALEVLDGIRAAEPARAVSADKPLPQSTPGDRRPASLD